jgi:hypothetical protein
MKVVEKSEQEHRVIFEKTEENRVVMEILREETKMNNENQIRSTNYQEIIITNQEKNARISSANQIIAINNQEVIIENQKSIKSKQIDSEREHGRMIDLQEELNRYNQNTKYTLELIREQQLILKNEMETYEEKTMSRILGKHFKKIRCGLNMVMNRAAAIFRMINDTNEEDEDYIQEAYTYGSFLLTNIFKTK